MTQSLRTSYCEKIPRDRMQMFPLSQATHLHSLIILFPFNTNGHFVMISTGPTDPKKTLIWYINSCIYVEYHSKPHLTLEVIT